MAFGIRPKKKGQCPSLVRKWCPKEQNKAPRPKTPLYYCYRVKSRQGQKKCQGVFTSKAKFHGCLSDNQSKCTTIAIVRSL